jgi:hypothetical protein
MANYQAARALVGNEKSRAKKGARKSAVKKGETKEMTLTSSSSVRVGAAVRRKVGACAIGRRVDARVRHTVRPDEHPASHGEVRSSRECPREMILELSGHSFERS